eukprot:Clim_evm54s246 gene=Clim_evmTU54s246
MASTALGLVNSVLNGAYNYYRDINPSTLSGAIDILVIQQPDGTLKSTPFHVRFGKLLILRSKEREITILVNGQEYNHVKMKLGDEGEAYFVRKMEGEKPIDPSIMTSPLLGPETPRQTPTHGPQAADLNSSFDGFSLDDDKPKHASGPSSPDPFAAGDTPAGEKMLRDSDPMDVWPDEKRKESAEKSKYPPYRPPPSAADDLLDPLKEEEAGSVGEASTTESGDTVEANENHRPSTPTPDDQKGFAVPGAKGKEQELADTEAGASPSSWAGKALLNGLMGMLRGNQNDDTEKLGKYLGDMEASELQEHYRHVSKKVEGYMEDAYTRAVNPKFRMDPEQGEIPAEQAILQKQRGKDDANPVTMTANMVGAGMADMTAGVVHAVADPTKDTAAADKSQGEAFNINRTSYAKDGSPEGRTPPPQQQLQKAAAATGAAGVQSPLNVDMDSPQSPPNPAARAPSKPRPAGSLGMPPHTAGGAASAHGTRRTRGHARENSLLDIQPRHLEGMSVNPLGFFFSDMPQNTVRLSLCGGLHDDAISAQQMEINFEEKIVTWQDFQTRPAQIMADPNLVVSVCGVFYNWATAAPIIMSWMVFRHDLPHDVERQLLVQQMGMSDRRTRKRSHTWRRKKKESKRAPTRGEKTAATTDTAVPATPPSEPQSVPIEGTPSPLRDSTVSESAADEQHHHPAGIKRSKTSPTLGSKDHGSENVYYVKSIEMTSEELQKMNLKPGLNEISFKIVTKLQGTAYVDADIYLWRHNVKIVISDIDGTVTKSDALGHILPALGRDWTHPGLARLYTAIEKNGYKILFLSSRAIGQAAITRNFLRSIEQGNTTLPYGPVFLSPDRLLKALHREVVLRKPEEFKIVCLENIKSLFPEPFNPYYGGFGNRDTDHIAYRHVGVRNKRIFLVNPKGELKRAGDFVYKNSYSNLRDLVDQVFPIRREDGTTDVAGADADDDDDEDFSGFSFWRPPIPTLPDPNSKSADNAADSPVKKPQNTAETDSEPVGGTTDDDKSDAQSIASKLNVDARSTAGSVASAAAGTGGTTTTNAGATAGNGATEGGAALKKSPSLNVVIPGEDPDYARRQKEQAEREGKLGGVTAAIGKAVTEGASRWLGGSKQK